MSEFSHLLVMHKLVRRGRDQAPSALCGRFKVRGAQLTSADSEVTCLRCAKRLEANKEALQLWLRSEAGKL